MYTLSIILNLHREGDIAEKTIHNLQNILEVNNKKHDSWEEIEILAILDNADKITKNIVFKYQNLFNKIEEVDFRDAACARNFGVAVASKNFILFSDGDDYVDHNMLFNIYLTFYDFYNKIVKSAIELSQLSMQEHIAIFPQYLIEFPKLFQMKYCDSNDFIVQNNRFTHCYHSKIAIYRDILVKNKVCENEPPYGYEDWDLNNRLLARGIQFQISNYRLYYRRSDRESNFTNHVNEKCLVRNSPIYSYAVDHNLKDIEIKPIKHTAVPEKKKGIIHKVLSKSNTLRRIYHLLKNSIQKKPVDKSIFEDDKLFLESYGEKISYRKDIEFSNTEYFSSHLSIQSKIYNKLLEFLVDKKVVYFFPWIGLGGADKVSVEYTKALYIKNSCVITSINSGSRINTVNVPHLDLVSELSGWSSLSEDEQLHILVKAIINSDIKLVHIVNSDVALKTIKYYDKIYKEYNIKTIVTLFCPDYDWINQAYHGYPVMYPELFENANLILSDNNYWYNFFKELNKNRDFKYEKLASPTEQMKISYQPKKHNTKKILWASRICNQKLFGVFEEIVNHLPEFTFIIYGTPSEEKNNQKILKRLIKKENVEFRGEYQHISEIDLNEFDLYLFTSLFEGIPTIILDMVMGGIPIVSADVGGISEVLGQNYPLLVKKQSQASEYIAKIKEYYDNKGKIVPKMLEIRNFLIQNHNEKTFQHTYNTLVKDLLNDHR